MNSDVSEWASLSTFQLKRHRESCEAPHFCDSGCKCHHYLWITPELIFSSNEILNGVMRTSSPLCITELYKVMDLNGNSLPALMKHEKHSQFTQREGEWEGGVNDKRGRDVCCFMFVTRSAIEGMSGFPNCIWIKSDTITSFGVVWVLRELKVYGFKLKLSLVTFFVISCTFPLFLIIMLVNEPIMCTSDKERHRVCFSRLSYAICLCPHWHLMRRNLRAHRLFIWWKMFHRGQYFLGSSIVSRR